jgi:hypothetical protein
MDHTSCLVFHQEEKYFRRPSDLLLSRSLPPESRNLKRANSANSLPVDDGELSMKSKRSIGSEKSVYYMAENSGFKSPANDSRKHSKRQRAGSSLLTKPFFSFMGTSVESYVPAIPLDDSSSSSSSRSSPPPVNAPSSSSNSSSSSSSSQLSTSFPAITVSSCQSSSANTAPSIP